VGKGMTEEKNIDVKKNHRFYYHVPFFPSPRLVNIVNVFIATYHPPTPRASPREFPSFTFTSETPTTGISHTARPVPNMKKIEKEPGDWIHHGFKLQQWCYI
jgi:hypothetical protein